MKTAGQKLGERGETIAVSYLKNRGYKIIKRNHRIGKAEIDIIAETSDCIVFLEVKTRTSIEFGYPETFVSRKQEKMLFTAAETYYLDYVPIKSIRFDIIAIIITNKGTEIMHFEDAFWPMA